jgi:hypothetical protein
LGHPANPHYPTSIHPALNSFADDCAGTLARLVAYVGVLALLAMTGFHLWDELPDAATAEPTPQAGWSLASRPHPAFAVSSLDLPEKTETYDIFRHPEGAARTFFIGGPKGPLKGRLKGPFKAKSWWRNSKFTGPAVNSAPPMPPAPKSRPDGP